VDSENVLGEITSEAYEELRRIAASYLRGEREGHTLQPTALVHEAFVRILKQPDNVWKDRAHVIAFAARAMRRVLISYGVARGRLKRGGATVVQEPLEIALVFCDRRELNLSAVDEALQTLQNVNARQAEIVEMRFFGGLTIEEIAAALKVSPATVKREWSAAKLWLRCELCTLD
jgi:RNA polymerase sigma-70 factor (ECF subfamily)